MRGLYSRAVSLGKGPGVRVHAMPLARPRRPGAMGLLAVSSAAALIAGPLEAADTASLGARNGIAMYGEPALPEGFHHLSYANPDAPKGGRLAIGFEGTFDSLNPFNLNAGSAAQGLGGNVYQTLMTRSRDEPFTLYGLVAETIETDAARDWVTLRLDPRARFSDGTKVTADDVLFSFDLLKAHGRPQQRAAYAFVKAISAPDAASVHYDLSGSTDRELPLILALMPVLPRHALDVTSFDRSSLAPPVGSGPYRVVKVRPGLGVTLLRDPGYWGRDLPTQRGFYNFDEIDIDYFRDASSMFEAFQVGILDARIETSPRRWTAAYDFPAVREGAIRREALPIGGARGMDGFAFNLRRPVFQDPRVRQALGMVFDFEWLDLKLFDGLYTRTQSFFEGSELSSVGRPASEAERRLLARWPGAVAPEIMDGTAALPVTDASGADRGRAKEALAMLATLGFKLKDGRLLGNGVPLAFEIMVRDAQQEILALNYATSLARIGVAASVRRVDETQYERRRQTFDYDMTIGRWIASDSPGNEQRSRWGSASADQEASFNLSGARDPAIDGLIEIMVASRSREDFVTAARAYDRVLRSGAYIVPLFHPAREWVAAKQGLAHPAALPHYDQPVSPTLDVWWWKSKS